MTHPGATEADAAVAAFWRTVVDGLPAGDPRRGQPLDAWGFGDSAAMADELGALVVAGVKTATASLWWEYQAEGEPLPQPGHLSVVLDGRGGPLCAIETTAVWVTRFDRVDARQAFEEGEGDRSLAYWRRVHWTFFAPRCAALGREPAMDMPVVCERFRLVQAPSSARRT